MINYIKELYRQFKCTHTYYKGGIWVDVHGNKNTIHTCTKCFKQHWESN